MTRFNTQLVHGLPVGDNNTGAVNPPIYNSTTYAFERVDAMPRYDYARSGNPTRDFLEQQIAQLERSLADAEAKGDNKAASAVRETLETKRAWLAQISSSME